MVVEPTTVKQALAGRNRAVKYWEKAPLPFGRVQVPDAGIQALVDSSIRNIWQAREIKKGLTAFQVGPTCYGGLWIVDGAFLLEAAALLGAGLEARNGVAYELTEREGMVYGTGWDAQGIWNYFASFYGHAWLWQGNGRKAAQALAAFANHAAPTLVWREEQSLQGEPFKKVGDMPHNWASAEFIRLTVHLLALARGDELHLLEGLPPEWLGPGMVTRLNGVATPFGPLHLTVRADREGKTATLSVKPLAANCRSIAAHLPDGTTQRLDPRRGGRVTFAVP